MRKDIQALYESNLPVLYLQGACGNIDTYDFENGFIIKHYIEQPEDIVKLQNM
jgi:hypothetical protein